MAQSSISSSDLDLSMSRVSAPLKHPAYAHPSEYINKPARNNSTPNGWRPSYIPHVCKGHHYSDNRVRRNQSFREASKSLMNIDRVPGTNSSNSSEQDSPVNSRYRTLYWSSTSLLYNNSSNNNNNNNTSRASSPKVSHKHHLLCQVPGMDNPKKRLSKSSSIDSGTGSGSISGGSLRRNKPISPGISPGRKRKNSIGSASTTSSSSLGSLKEKLEKTEPVEVKIRSSLVSLLSRKGSSRRSSTSIKKSNEGAGSSPNLSLSSASTTSTDPSTLSPSPIVSSSSVTSPSKSSGFRESFKAAKKLLSPSSSSSSKATSESPKVSYSKNSNNTIAEEVGFVSNNTHEDNLFPDRNVRSRSNSCGSGKRGDGNVLVKDGVSPMHSKNGTANISSQAKESSGHNEKKQKDKDPNKTPTKNVLGKIFGKKSRGPTSNATASPTNNSTHSHNQEESRRQQEIPAEKNSPKIVNFESEPRKIVPKPRIVTLNSNNRGFKEMEVSEEAVALARKLREDQKQREEAKKNKEQLKETVIDEIIENDMDEVNNFSSQPPIPRPRRLSGSTRNNEDDELTQNHIPKLLLNSNLDTEETLQDMTTVTVSDAEASRNATETESTSSIERSLGSVVQGGKDGEENEEDSEESEVKTDESTLPELPFISALNSTPRSKGELDGGNYSNEMERQFGFKSPSSSQDDQLMRPATPSKQIEDPNNIENSQEYVDNDDDDASIATTVTTTASEMDTSFMLSRSLGLTEDEFSYTESFKQLKPFNFDHVDPIPEGKRERLYKVLVVGELGTGKTSIIKRYVHQFFSQHYRATIGVDFALKVLRWDPETVVRLQLWDIAGQERFGSMTRVYYKEAVGAFVVFDVTRAATLEAVPKWKADLDTKVVLPDGRPIPTVLLANKSDQPKEGIAANREKMNEFCQQQGFSAWFETSAKDNINIDESANFLVSKILDMDKWSQEPAASDPEKLDLTANGKHKAGGGSNCAC